MAKRAICVLGVLLVAASAMPAWAATYSYTVLPSDYSLIGLYAPTITADYTDPIMGTSSWHVVTDGTGVSTKFALYLTWIFGTNTVSFMDLKSIEIHMKFPAKLSENGVGGTIPPAGYLGTPFFTFYTAPTGTGIGLPPDGDKGAWYHDKIQSVPYRAYKKNDVANTWTHFVSGLPSDPKDPSDPASPNNRMAWYDGTQITVFGGSATGNRFSDDDDPVLSNLQSGGYAVQGEGYMGTRGTSLITGFNLGSFTLETGSTTPSDAYLDALRIELNNGDIYIVDFEGPALVLIPEPATLALLGMAGCLIARRRR